jgi:hypothetical protein
MSCPSRTPGGILTRKVCVVDCPVRGSVRRTAQDFVQRHQDVALDVLAGLGESFAFPAGPSRSTETGGRTPATPEELLEEIAEARAVEMEFRTVFRTSSVSTLRLGWLPFRVIPVCAQFIILSPLLWVAEDFVGLVDFLEFFFGSGLVLGDIGMISAGECAECLLDFRVARVSMHAENVVVVFEFNGHGWLRGNAADHSPSPWPDDEAWLDQPTQFQRLKGSHCSNRTPGLEDRDSWFAAGNTVL